jgi:hypothetical protein
MNSRFCVIEAEVPEPWSACLARLARRPHRNDTDVPNSITRAGIKDTLVWDFRLVGGYNIVYEAKIMPLSTLLIEPF